MDESKPGAGKSALIVWGGWDGHEPEAVARIFERELVGQGFAVEVSASLDSFRDLAHLQSLALIVPVYTAGTIEPEQLQPLLEAVSGGVGMAGCHGGMCDAFRNAPAYQFMTGGQWVAHPGNDGVNYRVCIDEPGHEIMRGIEDFDVSSEQYYMHVDPAVKVLASTHFPLADGPHTPNGEVDMPVTWTKFYGKGRVFYCALGHQANIVELPPVLRMITQGCVWAAS